MNSDMEHNRMEDEGMRKVNEYDVSTNEYDVSTNAYDVSTNAYVEWKSQKGEVAHIQLVGTTTEEQIIDLAELFDHRDYETITIDALSVADIEFSDGDRWTLEQEIITRIENDEYIVPPLIKMILNRENGSEFRVTKEGDIFTSDMRTLIHMLQVPETLVLEGIERIGNFVFCDMEVIKQIVFPEGLQYIGSWAFAGVDNLNSVVLPDSVTELGEKAFYDCFIDDLKLSRNLRSIPYACFYYNDLEHLEIPPSVREIGIDAFYGGSFSKVVIPEGVERIEYNAFTGLCEIELPASLKDIASDFYYEFRVDFEIDPPYVRISADNPIFYAKDGSLYFRENDKLALDSGFNGIPDSYYNR